MKRAAWLPMVLLPLAGSACGSADLELQPQAAGARVRLCFVGETEPVRYQVITEMQGSGGIARTRQAGEVKGDGCPLDNRLGAAPGSLVQVWLTWERQGQPQPAVARRLRL